MLKYQYFRIKILMQLSGRIFCCNHATYHVSIVWSIRHASLLSRTSPLKSHSSSQPIPFSIVSSIRLVQSWRKVQEELIKYIFGRHIKMWGIRLASLVPLISPNCKLISLIVNSCAIFRCENAAQYLPSIVMSPENLHGNLWRKKRLFFSRTGGMFG